MSQVPLLYPVLCLSRRLRQEDLKCKVSLDGSARCSFKKELEVVSTWEATVEAAA